MRRYFESLDDEDDEDDDDEQEDGDEATNRISTDPVEEAPVLPRTSSQTNETPSAVSNPHPAEETHQRPPEGPVAKKPKPPPKPKLHWYRLFTGRAVLRDEDGKVVRSVMPGEPDYPHHFEFINWN